LCSNYNYGQFVGRAIQSILDQTYTHFELIICDDGSTDDSCARAQTYVERDKRVKLIRKGNGGQASGYNAAYRQSSGDVICLLDSDDVYHPTKLEKVIEALQKWPDSGFVGHRLLRVSQEGQQEGITPLFAQMPSGWQAESILREAGFLPYLAPGGGLGVRREIAERIFPLPENGPMRNCGDVPFMLLAPLMTPLIAINEPLAEWHRHGDNYANRSRIDAAYVERQLNVYEHQWNLQRRYLAQYHLSMADSLATLDTNCHVASMRYTLVRLRGQRWLGAYQAMIRCLSVRKQLCSPGALFWIPSILMPRALFVMAFNYVVAPSPLKKLCARIARRAKSSSN
jgi:glycosyltransferase involved in cell wall biosynthesis